MAVLSKFHGIVIQMLSARPFAPRFHAIYGPSELIVQINPPSILSGEAPPHIREMVLEWAEYHRQELLAAWQDCQTAHTPPSIDPFQ